MAARRCISSVFRPGLFRGKTAIVTGGGTGIGQGITRELLYLGCNVMIASRKLERLTAAAKEMRGELDASNPAKLEVTQCNIRNEAQIKDMMSKTVDTFGRIDYLVNNGGGQFMAPAENISTKGFHAVIETNLYGTFMACREAFHHSMKDHGGSIVNILVDMWKGFPTMSPSGASRAGVENLIKSLALEWAQHGIRINGVAPGSTIYSETAEANYGEWKVFDEQVKRIPTKRLGTVEEVSAAVLFLLSPAAAFISGETIKVDGAQSLYNTSLPLDIPDHKKLPAYRWKNDSESS